MIVQSCHHAECKKHGHDRHGAQRFRCLLCGATFVQQQPKPLGDMRITMDEAVKVLNLLLEGVSIRATSRLTGLAKRTVLDLLVLVGERCRVFWSHRMNGIQCTDVQVDEVWGFVGCKERVAVRLCKPAEFGDAYCFTALERTTKLLISYHLGKRSAEDTLWFCEKLAQATVGRFQLTTDGFKHYTFTMVEAFRNRIDFAQLIKIFGHSSKVEGTYTPAVIKSTRRRVCAGKPDMSRVSTSHIERSNRTWRMRCRRMTRLTDAHSKKWQNHEAAMALTFVAYNFVTVHGTLGTTPAVAAGLASEPWTIERLLTGLATRE